MIIPKKVLYDHKINKFKSEELRKLYNIVQDHCLAATLFGNHSSLDQN